MRGTQLLTIVFSLIIFTGITASSTAFAESDDQNTLDAITDIEFRTVTDFHTYVPDSQLRFDVSCNQLAGEFAIGFNTFLQKSNGNPADVNDIRNFVFLQRGSSETGALIDAVNTGSDRLKLTAEVTCAKLLPESLPTVPYAPTEFAVVAGDKQATVSWEEPLFDGGSPITKYEISAMPDPKTTSAADVFVDTEDLEFTFDGLINGITYKFQVNTVNEIGSGIKSEILTATPFGVTVTTPTPTQVSTNDKITLCHNGKTTLFLPSQAVRAHLNNHDDYLGKCSASYDSTSPTPVAYTPPTTPVAYTPPTTPESTTSNEKTTVCHNGKQTLSLPSQAVKAHLNNHDDYLGQCTENSTSQLKAQKEADRLAKHEADKAQKEADRLAKHEAKLLKQEADKAQKEADRLAKQEADKQQREADKAQKEAEKLAKLESKNNEPKSK